MQRSLLQLLVEWNNDGSVLIQIVHENMAAALVVDNEAESSKSLDNLPA